MEAWLAAVADEMDDLGASLLALQEAPFFGDTSDPAVAQRLIVALQDIDRMAQTAQGLATATRALVKGGTHQAAESGEPLALGQDVTLQSLRDRLLSRCAAGGSAA